MGRPTDLGAVRAAQRGLRAAVAHMDDRKRERTARLLAEDPDGATLEDLAAGERGAAPAPPTDDGRGPCPTTRS